MATSLLFWTNSGGFSMLLSEYHRTCNAKDLKSVPGIALMIKMVCSTKLKARVRLFFYQLFTEICAQLPRCFVHQHGINSKNANQAKWQAEIISQLLSLWCEEKMKMLPTSFNCQSSVTVKKIFTNIFECIYNWNQWPWCFKMYWPAKPIFTHSIRITIQ